MARLIIDTSVLIRAERGSGALDDAVADDDDVAIAAVTAAELILGVELADGRRRDARRRFVERVLHTLAVEDYTLATARTYAGLLAHVRRAGQHPGAHDLIIAATAISSGRVVVTTDRRGFDLPGVTVRLLTAG